MSIENDVCVFGAGPAGLSAALSLQRAGYEVDVISGISDPFRSTFTRVSDEPDLFTSFYDGISVPVNTVNAVTTRGTNFAVSATRRYVVFDNQAYVSRMTAILSGEVMRLNRDELNKITVSEDDDGVLVNFGNGRAGKKYGSVVDATGVGARISCQVDRTRIQDFMVEAVYGGTYPGNLKDRIYLVFDRNGGTSWVCQSALPGMVDVVYTLWCWKCQFPEFLEYAPKGLSGLVKFANKELGTEVCSDKPEQLYSGMIRTQPTEGPNVRHVYAIGEAAGMANPVSGDSWQRALLSGGLVGDAISRGDNPRRLYERLTKRWKNGFMFGVAYKRLERCLKGKAGCHIDWLGEQMDRQREKPRWFVGGVESCIVDGRYPLRFLLSLALEPTLTRAAIEALIVQLKVLTVGYGKLKPINGLIPVD